MKLTDREEFLIEMYSYLKGGYDGYLLDTETYIYDETIKGRKKLSHDEVMEILNNKEKFLSIDTVFDELSYFGLDVDDFEWSDDEWKRKRLTALRLQTKHLNW